MSRIWPPNNLVNLARQLRPRIITFLGVLSTVILYRVDEIDVLLLIPDVVATFFSIDVVYVLWRLLEDTHSTVGLVV